VQSLGILVSTKILRLRQRFGLLRLSTQSALRQCGRLSENSPGIQRRERHGAARCFGNIASFHDVMLPVVATVFMSPED